jgi:hypothetical protein
MKPKPKKLEPKLGLDMPFEEALQRFIQTDPTEVENGIKKSKKKRPPGSKGKKRKPPGGIGQSKTVVSLRHRRMRKRNG